MPEAEKRHTKQHPIKQHTTMGTLPWAHLYGNTKQHPIMGAPAWAMPEAGEQYTKQHPIMGTPAWDELQYSAIIL